MESVARGGYEGKGESKQRVPPLREALRVADLFAPVGMTVLVRSLRRVPAIHQQTRSRAVAGFGAGEVGDEAGPRPAGRCRLPCGWEQRGSARLPAGRMRGVAGPASGAVAPSPAPRRVPSV